MSAGLIHFDDKQSDVTAVTADGTYTVPLGVSRLRVIGAGGGGGGGGGGASSDSANDHGPGGGAGGTGAPILDKFINVSPGDLLTITIGVGGTGGAGGVGGSDGNTTGNGSAGSSGTSSTVTGTDVDIIFPGADGGAGGIKTARNLGQVSSTPVDGNEDVNITDFSPSSILGYRGGIGNANTGTTSVPGLAGGTAWSTPRFNTGAAGGAGGANSGVNSGGSGGGGGGSSFGLGGVGGVGATGATDNAIPGGNAPATSYGAGGGGAGGAGSTVTGVFGKSASAGGDGANGVIYIVIG